MNQEDYRRLFKEAEAKWRASIPALPLNKLERRSLLQFRNQTVGELIGSQKIKGCGPDTSERLAARGFIEIRTREPDRLEGYILTAGGVAAAQALDRSL